MNETKEEKLPKHEEVELNKRIMSYFEAKDEMDKWNDRINSEKNMILELLRKNSTKSYNFVCDVKDEVNGIKKEITSFILCTRNNITYDMEKLKKLLSKKEQKELINKTYIVSDWDGLVETMKKYNVPAKEVKNCLICNEVVDTNKMQKMYDVGDFDIKKIKGAYTISVSQYLSVKSKNIK